MHALAMARKAAPDDAYQVPERKRRMLDSIPETMRVIVSEALAK
jgi:hypothetical protein